MENNHYKIHKPSPIDLILKYNLNFIEGNIVKYVLRSPFKGDRIGDLKKALYYAKLIKPIGYLRSFKEEEINLYNSVLLTQELLAVTTVIQSDIYFKEINSIVKYIQSAINVREVINWYTTDFSLTKHYELCFSESVTK